MVPPSICKADAAFLPSIESRPSHKKLRELETGIRQRASQCSPVPRQDQRHAMRSESVDCTRESQTTRANMLFSVAMYVRANLAAYRAQRPLRAGSEKTRTACAWRLLGSACVGRASLLLIANGHDTMRAKSGVRVDRAKHRQIDLSTSVTRSPTPHGRRGHPHQPVGCSGTRACSRRSGT